MEASNLPSQPPVVKVADVVLQVHKVTAGPDEEGTEPGGKQFNRVFFAMPSCVSLRIQIDNIGGLIWALLLVEASDSSVFELLDPLCHLEDSIPNGNEEVGYPPVVLDISIGGAFEYVFIVLDAVVESADLFVKAVDFASLLSVTLGDGCEEPLCDGSKDVSIEVRVGRQSGHNSTGQHRWFQTLDRMNQERDAVFSGRGVGEIDRAI